MCYILAALHVFTDHTWNSKNIYRTVNERCEFHGENITVYNEINPRCLKVVSEREKRGERPGRREGDS